MKRRICALSLLLILSVSLCLVPARADGLWSEDYYRAFDGSGELTEAERDSLDEECISFMQKYRVDMVLLALTEEDWDRVSTQEQAQDYYDDSAFGYGENRDGFLWVYNTDSAEVRLFCLGAAEDMIPREAVDALEGYTRRSDVYSALHTGIDYLTSCLDTGNASEQPERGTNAGLPAWYPASTENFPFFRDESAPRVVDNADIFTDDEERAMEARIAEIRGELQRDIVIYTDVTDYGLGHMEMAEDFYDYNGYGCGDEAEGMCLFIDMDPNDRGWWASCTGSKTIEVYTEEVANLLDDALYEYMAAGAYGAGVADWVENIRTMYAKGTPFAPDWFPMAGEAVTPRGEANPSLVVDELGLLTEAEVAELNARAEAISAEHGVDVAIHIMRSPVGMNYGEVSALFYPYMGYAEDGVMLTVLKREGYLAVTRIAAFGSAVDKLTETNEQRLRDFCENKTDEHEYYAGLSQWLTQVDHMLRTGRVARSGVYWAVITAVSAALGSIFGGISLGVARAKMAPPKEKRDADAYFDPATSRIQDAGAQFLYTTTSRHYDPPQQKSSGGSRSGGSSYRSSHSGSSGRSHSGSGRRF